MKRVYCCGCKRIIKPILTNGKYMYPHRPDLRIKPFWMCRTCKNFVGCHPGTTNPLGSIATRDIKNARAHVHEIMDPIWKSGYISRSQLYSEISYALGYIFHTANINNIKDANNIIQLLLQYKVTVEPIEGDFI